MTNLEFLQGLPIHKIAENFIKNEIRQNGGWGIEHQYIVFRTSDELVFTDYDEAIGHEIQWLLSEREL